jgi:hypothetical protein
MVDLARPTYLPRTSMPRWASRYYSGFAILPLVKTEPS